MHAQCMIDNDDENDDDNDDDDDDDNDDDDDRRSLNGAFTCVRPTETRTEGNAGQTEGDAPSTGYSLRPGPDRPIR